MIGDSVVADIIGAKNVGLKSVLVRNNSTDYVEYYSNDLKGLKGIII
jgi:ribonucleotide monophosphatase NagD (HAD superfamily)